MAYRRHEDLGPAKKEEATLMARYEWRTPDWSWQRFRRLVVELDDFPEDSDIAHAIRDEIRSLPNYPHRAGEDDEIKPVITSVR
jgi:hypothetical protein